VKEFIGGRFFTPTDVKISKKKKRKMMNMTAPTSPPNEFEMSGVHSPIEEEKTLEEPSATSGRVNISTEGISAI